MRFIGGIPRSGSTLFAALLNEHTDLNVTPTGFLTDLVQGMAERYTNSMDRVAWKDGEGARRRYEQAVLSAAYGYIGPKGVEKSRDAPYLCGVLKQAANESPKVVLCVRDLREVASSTVRLYANRPELIEAPLASRLQKWFEETNRPLGYSLSLMMQTIADGRLDDFHVVRFEDMIADPERVVSDAVRYLGGRVITPPVQTAGDNREHDPVHGPVGNHRVLSGPVTPPSVRWPEIIGQQLGDGIINGNREFYWRFYPEVFA